MEIEFQIIFTLYTLALVYCVKGICFLRAPAKLLADTFLLFAGVWIPIFLLFCLLAIIILKHHV